MMFPSLKEIKSRQKKSKRGEIQLKRHFEQLDDDQSFSSRFESDEASRVSPKSTHEPFTQNQKIECQTSPSSKSSKAKHTTCSPTVLQPSDDDLRCIQLVIHNPEASLSTLEMSLTSLEGLEVSPNDLSRSSILDSAPEPCTTIQEHSSTHTIRIANSSTLPSKEKKTKKKSKRKEKSPSPSQKMLRPLNATTITVDVTDRRACLAKTKTMSSTTTLRRQWNLSSSTIDSTPSHQKREISLLASSLPNHAA